MKKFLAIVLVSLFGFSAWANGMPPRHAPNFERLADHLNVSDEQLDSFLAVMNEQHLKRKEIRKEGRDAMKGKMDQLRDELVVKLSGILNEEQLAKFKTKMEKRQAKKEKYKKLNKHRSKPCCDDQQ